MGDLGILELTILTAPVWAILCALIAPSKNRSPGKWAVLGLIFGVFAFVAIVIFVKLPPRDAPRSPQVF